MYKIFTVHDFIQFYLVCLSLLIENKAVLLTFKNKGVFLGVDPQKCLLRRTFVYSFVDWGDVFI